MAILHSQICSQYSEQQFFILFKADYKHWLQQRNKNIQDEFVQSYLSD